MATIKGVPAGSAYVTITADMTGFKRDLESGMGRSLKGAERSARGSMDKIGGIATGLAKTGALAIAGGAVAAVASIGKVGMAYQDSMNSFQAVTAATGSQMAKIAARAKALGNDLTLPGTSAAGAAEAMTELAKSGLSVDEAMAAAKGTLQLATAAQIDGAQAAEIQGNALSMFGLKGSEAGHVADSLANAANAASGEITDFAAALKYIGPIARSLGIGIDDVNTSLGVLANNGIKGEMAGTILRSAIVSLQAPSNEAKKALKALGVQAFDAQGKFRGMRPLIDDLTKAQKRMTDQEFGKWAAEAFGTQAVQGIQALAASGVPAFDSMSAAIRRQGGAAEVAAAKSKGLRGAWDSLMSTLETIGIQVFEKAGPGVEKGLRLVTENIPVAIDSLTAFGKTVFDVVGQVKKTFEDLGGSKALKSIADSIKTIADTVGTKLAEQWKRLQPTVDKMVQDTLPTLKRIFKDVSDNIKRVAESPDLARLFDNIGRIADVLKGPLAAAWKAVQPMFVVLGGTAFAGIAGMINMAANSFGVLAAQLEIAQAEVKFVGDALKPLAEWIAFTAWPVVREFATNFYIAFRDLATRVGQAVWSLVTGVWNLINPGFNKVVTFVAGSVGRIAALFTSLWSQASGIFNSLRSTVVTAFTGMWTSAVAAVSSGVTRVAAIVSGLRGSVTGAVSGAMSWLYQAGRDIISGLLNGLDSMLGGVTTKLKQLAALFNIKLPSWVGARSPSKIQIKVGKDIGAGLAIGLDRSMPTVTRAAQQLADASLVDAGAPTPALRGHAPLTAPAVAREAPVSITVNGALDPNAVGRQIMDLLRREGRLSRSALVPVVR
jgi:TP901 family phage tail tape measure protein